MKRYIKTPLKYALPLLFIGSLVLVSISGCTSSSNTSSSGSGTTLAPDNLAGAITNQYTAANYTINTPFTMTKQGDTITYKGVVTDGPKVATPYKRNITIVLTPGRTTAWATYNKTIGQQQARGYQKFMSDTAEGNIYWVGYLGTTYSSNPSTPKVRDDLHDPSNVGLTLPAADYGWLYFTNADLSTHYAVLTNEQTPV
jgi:hypothetical protein